MNFRGGLLSQANSTSDQPHSVHEISVNYLELQAAKVRGYISLAAQLASPKVPIQCSGSSKFHGVSCDSFFLSEMNSKHSFYNKIEVRERSEQPDIGIAINLGLGLC